MHEDLEQAVALLAKNMKLSTGSNPSQTDGGRKSKSPTADESAPNSLTASTASKTGMKSHLMSASDIARKIDGQKPQVGPIGSVLKAQQAKQKEAELARKRAADREARDRRKREEAVAKEEKEKREAEVAKKERLALLEKNRITKLEIERKRREQADKLKVQKEEQARRERAAAQPAPKVRVSLQHSKPSAEGR